MAAGGAKGVARARKGKALNSKYRAQQMIAEAGMAGAGRGKAAQLRGASAALAASGGGGRLKAAAPKPKGYAPVKKHEMVVVGGMMMRKDHRAASSRQADKLAREHNAKVDRSRKRGGGQGAYGGGVQLKLAKKK